MCSSFTLEILSVIIAWNWKCTGLVCCERCRLFWFNIETITFWEILSEFVLCNILIFKKTKKIRLRAHVGGRCERRSRLVKVDFAFSLVKFEVQVALYFWRVALAYVAARVFFHLSFMKTLISCLLKPVVFVKYFERDFLGK